MYKNTMKKFSEQLHTKASTTRLRIAEKRALRERVVSYMEYHPLPASKRQSSSVPVNPTEITEAFTLVKVNWRRVLQFGGAALGVLLLSVTYIAERAVPGDTLYAVKISFNEELRGTLALSSYEKVVWETERLNRRIAEARLLASEGKLTDEVEEQVAIAVKTHSDNARREIDSLKQTDREGAALATIKLATALDVQSTTMNVADEETLADGHSTARIASAISASQAAEAINEAIELPSYDRLMARVEQESTRAYELLSSVKRLATEGEQTDIRRRMEDIERAILDVVAQRPTDEEAARAGLLTVLQRTQRLIIFMTNIDVRALVSVEQIVPVTRTRDERLIALRQSLAEAKTYINSMTEAVLAEVAPDLADKAGPAVLEGAALVVEVEAALSDEGAILAPLEGKLVEALALLQDAALLINLKLDPTPTPEEDLNPVLETILPSDVSTSTVSTTTPISTSTSSRAISSQATSTAPANLTEV